jgi:hypothetical protein
MGTASPETRYRIVSALLTADGPLTAAEVAERAELPVRRCTEALAALVEDGSVVRGTLLPHEPGPHYVWAERWQAGLAEQADAARQAARQALEDLPPLPDERLDPESAPSTAFHDYVINTYAPPAGKPYLVFLQCSVRRPFSSSPSHGTLRKALTLATGLDPAHDFESCPVHVVVLASKVGPVPYELQEVYPANVRSGGVKHFGPEHYERVRPVLARRMADYIETHGRHYRHMTAFAHSRYGEVMAEACRLAGVEFPILPDPAGPRVPSGRTYWGKCWIQLFLEVVNWLPPEEQEAARERLREQGIEYERQADPGGADAGER